MVRFLIVTNNHVVADAKSLSVGFVDGKSASATIRGTDSDADLAVVEVDTKNMKSSTLKGDRSDHIRRFLKITDRRKSDRNW